MPCVAVMFWEERVPRRAGNVQRRQSARGGGGGGGWARSATETPCACANVVGRPGVVNKQNAVVLFMGGWRSRGAAQWCSV